MSWVGTKYFKYRGSIVLIKLNLVLMAKYVLNILEYVWKITCIFISCLLDTLTLAGGCCLDIVYHGGIISLLILIKAGES